MSKFTDHLNLSKQFNNWKDYTFKHSVCMYIILEQSPLVKLETEAFATIENETEGIML